MTTLCWIPYAVQSQSVSVLECLQIHWHWVFALPGGDARPCCAAVTPSHLCCSQMQGWGEFGVLSCSSLCLSHQGPTPASLIRDVSDRLDVKAKFTPSAFCKSEMCGYCLRAYVRGQLAVLWRAMFDLFQAWGLWMVSTSWWTCPWSANKNCLYVCS